MLVNVFYMQIIESPECECVCLTLGMDLVGWLMKK